MVEYIRSVWDSRYFFVNLSKSDLRSKWRRSFFGVLWSIIQPLGMTALLSLVFSRLFKVDITVYAPYILSGIIVWDYISTTLVGGSVSFIHAEHYIKQCKKPLLIYTLRTSLTNIIVAMLASIVLFVWAMIVFPANVGWCWLAALTLFPILFIIVCPLATILGYISVRFRDMPHAMNLILQSLWFISPVYFQTSLFRSGGLNFLVDYNPIYHVLQIIRSPLLDGVWPTLTNYAFCFGTAAIFIAAAVLVGIKAERRVIFYL